VKPVTTHRNYWALKGKATFTNDINMLTEYN